MADASIKGEAIYLFTINDRRVMYIFKAREDKRNKIFRKIIQIKDFSIKLQEIESKDFSISILKINQPSLHLEKFIE